MPSRRYTVSHSTGGSTAIFFVVPQEPEKEEDDK